MRAKELGGTGVRIPEIGLGTHDYRGGRATLEAGFAAGACFVDTAETYGTEPIVGRALAGRRGEVFVATKVSPGSFAPADLRGAVDRSLGTLGVERIDLLQLHAPNPAIPIADTMGTLGDLTDEGKIRFIGVSNFSVAELRAARLASDRHPVVSNQVRYNLIDRTIESGLLQYCQAERVTVIAYSPLSRDVNRIRDCDPDGVLDDLARRTGKTWAQIVLNWCLSREGVVAIPRSNSADHVIENCGASGWRLEPEHLALLDERIRHRRRGCVDRIVRRFAPAVVRGAALRAAQHLPVGMRRRLM